MSAKNGVKHDPSAWFELLSEYRLTTLPYDTVLSGVLREDLSPDHPDVLEAIAAWPAPVHLEHGVDGIDVVLVYQLKAPKKDSLLVHALLLLATLVTTLGSGALMAGADPFATRFLELPGFTLPYPSGFDGVKLWLGASFALPFLGVLLSHEMGHFYAARMHRVRASLPYFLPFPPYFSVIGPWVPSSVFGALRFVGRASLTSGFLVRSRRSYSLSRCLPSDSPGRRR